MRNGLAPTAVAPAVGWICFGPKSGSRDGSLPMSSRRPSNSPFLTSGKFLREGHAIVHGDAADGNERHHVRRAHPWVLALVVVEVDEVGRFLRELESRLDDALPAPHKGEHGSVMGGVWIG